MCEAALALWALLAGAAGAAEGPLLLERIGGLDHAGVAWECRLYPNHPELRGKEATLRSLIAVAANAPIEKAARSERRVPSLEYVAYEPERGSRGRRTHKAVTLLKDHLGREWRSGGQAEELIALTRRLCQESFRRTEP